LSPKKSKYGFRVVTQLDPLDFLLFSGVVKELGEDIENRRIAVADQRVFSYRFNPDENGRLFEPTINYTTFHQTSKRIAEERSEYEYIAIADISDFYPRIYHHRLEGALQSCTTKASHVSAIMHLLSSWNGTESYGIPVGSQPVALLAEIALNDVDQALLAQGIRFLRFNDDYRIFAKTHAEAYRSIAFLADILFKNHGLTLQAQKTKIVSRESFINHILRSHEDSEVDSFFNRFDEIVADLGLESRYEQIVYEDLTEEQQQEIDSLNLVELFYEAVSEGDEVDQGLIRFVLGRMSQLNDPRLVDSVLDEIDHVYPSFPDVIRYLSSLRGLSYQKRSEIGGRVIGLIRDSIISELPYHKTWALELFSSSRDWNNDGQFQGLLTELSDNFSRRKIILSMGRASKQYFFQSNWRSLFDEPHWPRRAMIAGASCLAPDPRKHWYKSITPHLDKLELAVMRWAKSNPLA
jgi:hypothetical protein